MNAWLIIIPVVIALWLVVFFFANKGKGGSA